MKTSFCLIINWHHWAACQVHYRHDALFLASLSTSARRKGTDALPHRPSSHDEGKEPKKSSKAKPHDPTASPKKGEDRSKVEKKHISK